MVTDYERANCAAIRECFPEVEIKGCLFHYSQAVMRLVRKMDNDHLYGHDKDFTRFVKYILSLPLLPAVHIKHVFTMICSGCTTSLKIKICDYVRKKWIESRTYSVESISVYGMSIRTNNDYKGYHNRIRQYSQDNLGFYKLAEFLGKEADHVANNVTLVALDTLTRLQKPKYIKNNEDIRELMTAYLNGHIGCLKFLLDSSYKINCNVNTQFTQSSSN